MNKATPDMMSTLVDNELNEWELKGALNALERDKDMQACWRNYHLIGDAMRGSVPNHVDLGFTDRVSRALEHEPLYFKPQPAVPSSSNFSRTKTAIGFALAASLSAIAVVGVMGIEQKHRASGPGAVEAMSAPAPVVATTAPVAITPASTTVATVDGVTKGAREQPKLVATLASVKPMLASAGSANAAQPRKLKLQSTVVARSQPEGDLYEYLMNYHSYNAQNENEDALSYLRVVSYATAQ